MKDYTAIIKTPVGKLLLSESNGAITQCRFTQRTPHTLPVSPVLRLAARQLTEYFAAQRADFDLPLAPCGTRFQHKVWGILQTIPHGERWSYQQLAREVGSPNAWRAAGTANAKNPICIIIPCHRVIRSSGATGGYAGGEAVKAWLLEFEKEGGCIEAV